ncbi:hypothetical protein Hanom_Chr08g00757951 [Helianthus anomalus]
MAVVTRIEQTKVLLNWKVNAMIDEFVECGLHFLAIATQTHPGMTVLRALPSSQSCEDDYW